MQSWFFTEDAYPYLPDAATYESIRVNLPNKYYDPDKGADLYHMYLDLWCAADELGLEVMVNEHHQTATCVVPAAPIMLGILARQTRRARLLILGNPIANRREPVRVAEEMAMVDVYSRGRLECGFVRGVPYEVSPANSNPVRMNERQWEAMDLIVKAWTTHDGPFTHEGRFFHHRMINIWPRPWQQPHPRMWSATGDPNSAAEVGRRGLVHVLVLRGPEGTRRAYAAHRTARAEAGLPKVTTDNFAYAAFVYVGDTDEEGLRVGSKLLWFLHTSLKSAPQYSRFLPGSVVPEMAPQVYRPRPAPPGAAPALSAAQNAARLTSISVEQAMAEGIVFAGNPDSVYRQIMTFYEQVGGFGHLSLIGRTGFMTHAESEKSIRLFSKEVLPRLREIKPVTVD